MDAAKIKSEIRKLPYRDRLLLLHELWDQTYPDPAADEPNEELLAELDERVAEHETSPTRSRTWEEVRADIQARNKLT